MFESFLSECQFLQFFDLDWNDTTRLVNLVTQLQKENEELRQENQKLRDFLENTHWNQN